MESILFPLPLTPVISDFLILIVIGGPLDEGRKEGRKEERRGRESVFFPYSIISLSNYVFYFNYELFF